MVAGTTPSATAPWTTPKSTCFSIEKRPTRSPISHAPRGVTKVGSGSVSATGSVSLSLLAWLCSLVSGVSVFSDGSGSCVTVGSVSTGVASGEPGGSVVLSMGSTGAPRIVGSPEQPARAGAASRARANEHGQRPNRALRAKTIADAIRAPVRRTR
jgi:hypothetical protein